jgi:hypothetical protein
MELSQDKCVALDQQLSSVWLSSSSFNKQRAAQHHQRRRIEAPQHCCDSSSSRKRPCSRPSASIVIAVKAARQTINKVKQHTVCICRAAGKELDKYCINCWSGPRCCSTSLMYAFAQRNDTQASNKLIGLGCITYVTAARLHICKGVCLNSLSPKQLPQTTLACVAAAHRSCSNHAQLFWQFNTLSRAPPVLIIHLQRMVAAVHPQRMQHCCLL